MERSKQEKGKSATRQTEQSAGNKTKRGSRNRPDARRTLPRIIEEEAGAAEEKQTDRVFNPFTSKDLSSARAAWQVGKGNSKPNRMPTRTRTRRCPSEQAMKNGS